MFDKILLAALILILPITILITNYYAQKSQQQLVTQENLEQVNNMLEQLQKSLVQKPQSITMPDIAINTVFYSTESSELIISGLAPKSDLSMQISVLEKNNLDTNTQDSVVLGEAINVKALAVNKDGLFKYVYPVLDPDDLQSVEIKFQQGSAQKTVLYYLKQNTFEQY